MSGFGPAPIKTEGQTNWFNPSTCAYESFASKEAFEARYLELYGQEELDQMRANDSESARQWRIEAQVSDLIDYAKIDVNTSDNEAVLAVLLDAVATAMAACGFELEPHVMEAIKERKAGWVRACK